MSRGNQRAVDRQRSQKRADKNVGKKKKSADNGRQALTNKKEHDAEIMRQKQQKAEQKKVDDGQTHSIASASSSALSSASSFASCSSVPKTGK